MGVRTTTLARARTLASAIAAALAVAACSTPTHKSQVRYAQRLAPQRIASQPSKQPGVAVRTLAVRVYADAEYRAQNLRWQQKFQHLIARTNAVVEPSFGVRLEVASAEPWERDASDQDLEAMLAELERVDPGQDASWVIGLVTALPHVTSSVHLLGGARPLGRHIILRGFNDTAERNVLDKALASLSEAEREDLYVARRAHKELAVFLHEWAHTLGAMHTVGPTELMAPAYDASASQFAEANTRIIQLGVKYRGMRDDTGVIASRWNTDLLELLEANKWDGWIEEDYKLLVGFVKQGPQASPEVKVSAELTPRGRRAFYRALDLQAAARYDEAFREILPLTEQYESEPDVMRLGCKISAAAKGTAYPTPELCRRAAELAPENAEALVELSRVQFADGDKKTGLATLRAAHERLATSGAEAPPEQWLELAATYQKLQAVTWMEQALSAAGDSERAQTLAGWAAQTRRRYGLAPGAVPPEAEAQYLGAIKEVLSLTYGNQFDAAERMAKSASKVYPQAAGPEIAMCDLELRRRNARAAQRHCERAIERYDRAVWAMYLLATIQAHDKKHRQAIGHLESAVDIEPSMQAVWRLLAREYETVGAANKLEQLREKYRAQFNAEL